MATFIEGYYNTPDFMFLTMQFPLFDNRYFKAVSNRDPNPDWLEHHKSARIRYFGEITERNKKYIGPWDDEKQYCSVHGVFNFSGVKANEFYPLLYNSDAHARILFRRFQSDGRCMAKFEVGFNDSIEDVFKQQSFTPQQAKAALISHLQKYLLCPVRIKVGNRLSKFTALAEAGNFLRSAYFWASSTGEKSFDNKLLKQHVENFDPALLIHVDPETINLDVFADDKVEMPELKAQGVDVYSLSIPYTFENRKYQVRTWMIAVKKSKASIPVLRNDFKDYSDTIRNLRINLLRINIETILQRKLIANLNSQNPEYQIENDAAKERISRYLHKIFLNLSNIKRNKQEQEQLVQAAFHLDEKYNGSESLDDRIAGMEYYKGWLKSKEISSANTQVMDYVVKNESGLLHKQSEAAKKLRVFISYNHHDQKTAVQLRDALEQEGIDTTFDSDDMLAGTAIQNFIIESIKNTDATVMICSKKSLLSGWVALETINTIMLQQFVSGKKFISCFIDSSFTNPTFVDDATEMIDTTLQTLQARLTTRYERNQATSDIDDEKERLIKLRSNLPAIIQHLKSSLGLNLGKKSFAESFPKLLKSLRS